MTRRILRGQYAEVSRDNPQFSWRDAMRTVLFNRVAGAWIDGDEIFNLKSDLSPEELTAKVRQIVDSCESNEELIDRVIQYEEEKAEYKPPPGSEWAVSAVTDILSEGRD